MFNLNRTKILQYLVDFMVKRKNSQLDLLNFNYLASTGVTVEKSSSATSGQLQPDPTKQPPSEKRPRKFFDTSYNFIVRSDPIYLMACSRFQTNIRNVIRCRSASGVQMNSFERRPFDNNILRNRRIGKRLVNEREDLKEVQVVPEKVRRPNEVKFPPMQTQPTIIQNSSPILVSDTPPPSENSSPPPIQPPVPNNTEKPTILKQYVLQRAFSERVPILKLVKKVQSPNKELPKFDFPKIITETLPTERQNAIRQHPKRRKSVKTCEYQISNQIPIVLNGETVENHITVNELKTLSDNGTEIIPTSAIRKTIACRRKTVDERAQILKANSAIVELKKVAPAPPMSEPIKPTAESAHRALMKRRQSCHERILASSAAQKANEANIGQNYITFLKTQFDNGKNKKELQFRQMHQQMQMQQQVQKQQMQHYMQDISQGLKQVRFENPAHQQPIRPNPVQYVQAQPPAPVQHQTIQRPSSSFFEQQHQKFVQERLIRDRYYDQVETLQDREAGQDLQQPLISPKTTRVPQEKSPRLTQRPPVMNDEKMMVAYQQLQSLHDSNSFGLQQYTDHLKNLHQYKPGFKPTNVPRQSSPRENYYPNTQHQQVVATTTVPQLPFFYPPPANTTVVTSNSYPITSTDQSLQKKLKSKSKTLSNYVEPNQAITKPFYNPPNSTYYSDPYAPTLKKTPPIPTSLTAFQPLQPQVAERSNAEMQMHLSPQQMQNFWMLQRQQTSQPNSNSNVHIARPIPISRVQATPVFSEPRIQNASFQAQTLQHEQQADYLRQYYQQHHHPKNF